jgi:hypothetical protein
MNIFNLHSTVLGDYRDFVRSFFSVADDRAREFIDRELVEQARLSEPSGSALKLQITVEQKARLLSVPLGRRDLFGTSIQR